MCHLLILYYFLVVVFFVLVVVFVLAFVSGLVEADFVFVSVVLLGVDLALTSFLTFSSTTLDWVSFFVLASTLIFFSVLLNNLKKF